MEKRQIKFRAWDKEKNEFVNFNDFQDFAFAKHFGKELHIHCGLINNPEWFDIQQYTGLKDKNGKEIYEGDIVHFNTLSGNNMYYEVRWSDAKTGFKPTRLTKTNQAEIEIIGNIYENPNLLSHE